MNRALRPQAAFTIVELLVVVVVIAILAAITTVAYNGISNQAEDAAIKTELNQFAKKVETYKINNNDYPTGDAEEVLVQVGLSPSDGTTYEYSIDASGSSPVYCLSAAKNGLKYYISSTTAQPVQGECAVVMATDGTFLQEITSENCPTTRIRGVDARDNHTYWVQKLADGKCWMLTNLGYAGGGTNTYSDVKTLTNGTGSSTTYTAARYYVVPSTTNYTTEPTAPSTSTNGTGQYGYMYNWCAAMGGQSTAACANATTPAVNPSISICPAGWRLPTGVVGGDMQQLNTAVNGGLTNTDAGLISTWLGQRGGSWGGLGFTNQGSNGYYWTSSTHSAPYALRVRFDSGYVSGGDGDDKYRGFAVRCIAIES